MFLHFVYVCIPLFVEAPEGYPPYVAKSFLSKHLQVTGRILSTQGRRSLFSFKYYIRSYYGQVVFIRSEVGSLFFFLELERSQVILNTKCTLAGRNSPPRRPQVGFDPSVASLFNVLYYCH